MAAGLDPGKLGELAKELEFLERKVEKLNYIEQEFHDAKPAKDNSQKQGDEVAQFAFSAFGLLERWYYVEEASREGRLRLKNYAHQVEKLERDLRNRFLLHSEL